METDNQKEKTSERDNTIQETHLSGDFEKSIFGGYYT
jgi:hypothetical protein